jgi:hypothetical protein
MLSEIENKTKMNFHYSQDQTTPKYVSPSLLEFGYGFVFDEHVLFFQTMLSNCD